MQRPPNGQPRHSARPDIRTMDADLVTLAEKKAENERALRHEIESKVLNHWKWNHNHIDLTKDPLSPVKQRGSELKFRPAKTQYLMTPPASNSSESMDVDEDAPEPMDVDEAVAPVFQFKAGGAGPGQLKQASQPAFRRRIGRLSRLWIDRRGMRTAPKVESDEKASHSDRWKYDSDSDNDEPPLYEVDAFDTRALDFRSRLQLHPYMTKRQIQPDGPVAGGHGNRALPPAASQAQAAS